jgi:hypothetical protein
MRCMLGLRLAPSYLVDTERLFGIDLAASVILGSFSKKIFNLKKVGPAQISLGPPQRGAVSCFGVGRLVI